MSGVIFHSSACAYESLPAGFHTRIRCRSLFLSLFSRPDSRSSSLLGSVQRLEFFRPGRSLSSGFRIVSVFDVSLSTFLMMIRHNH